MNSKGFTLVELLATLVVLGIVTSIVVVGLVLNLGETKTKTEEIFVNTIEDAMDMYLSSDAKRLSYGNTPVCTLKKTMGNVNVYKVNVTFNDVINSEYRPLLQEDLVNPANESENCALASNISVSIYRDEYYVYYYKINKNDFNCLNANGYITNLPDGSGC